MTTAIYYTDFINIGRITEYTLLVPGIVFPVTMLDIEIRAVNNEDGLYGQAASIVATVGDMPVVVEPEPEQPVVVPDTLADIKNRDNWTRIGFGRTYSYRNGGTATVRNVPRGTRRVTFVGVPTLLSPVVKTGSTNNIETIFTSALAQLSAADQA